MARARVHDIVLFGATGFTGKLVAAYLAKTTTLDRTPWAIAGRDREKLHALRAELARTRPALEALPIVLAKSEDRASLAAMVKNTRVVVSTVGPFTRHGEALFQAAADHGTDYLDSSGEPAFVRQMRARHGARAKERGALMVSAAGLDCVPADLGAYFTMRELRPEGAVDLEGLFAFDASPSGGTLSSILAVLQDRKALRAPLGPFDAGPGRVVGPLPSRFRREPGLGYLVPMPSLDPEITLRSAAASTLYGPEFRYAHYLVLPTLRRLGALSTGMAGLYLAAQTAPTRRLVERIVSPGEGPTTERRKAAWFRLTLRARERGPRGERSMITEVTGGDPGYEETARMLGECALGLALDRARLPAEAGVLTPAQAFGDVLLDRLDKAGLSFRVVSR